MIVFDNTSYTGKPDLGLPRLYLAGTEFWPGVYPFPDRTRGDEANTRALARKVSASGQLLCLDIEHWPVDLRTASDASVQRSIDLIGEIIDWIRDERPGVRLGIYSILPLRDYWSPVNGRNLGAWFSANARLRKGRKRGRFIAEGLADKVDCVFPSIYWFYDDPAGWEKYAKANLKEARDYSKQVYAYSWMHYHESNKALGGQLIPFDFWQRTHDVCGEHADGQVVWGGFKVPWSDEIAKRMREVCT